MRVKTILHSLLCVGILLGFDHRCWGSEHHDQDYRIRHFPGKIQKPPKRISNIEMAVEKFKEAIKGKGAYAKFKTLYETTIRINPKKAINNGLVKEFLKDLGLRLKTSPAASTWETVYSHFFPESKPCGEKLTEQDQRVIFQWAKTKNFTKMRREDFKKIADSLGKDWIKVKNHYYVLLRKQKQNNVSGYLGQETDNPKDKPDNTTQKEVRESDDPEVGSLGYLISPRSLPPSDAEKDAEESNHENPGSQTPHDDSSHSDSSFFD